MEFDHPNVLCADLFIHLVLGLEIDSPQKSVFAPNEGILTKDIDIDWLCLEINSLQGL